MSERDWTLPDRVLYPSLDGEGLSTGPHAERAEWTWAAIVERFGRARASLEGDAAAVAELRHVEAGCTLADDVEQGLRRALHP